MSQCESTHHATTESGAYDANPLRARGYNSTALSLCVCRLITGEDIDVWCEQLVQEQGVLLLPAHVYDHAVSTDNGHFRFALGRKNMPECLQHLEAWLEQKYGSIK